jgi:diaminohydroxyphosphoribosylaminopyrimidine deaminase/5-amino-6-(5-phosphoribosylamino)uracil reductase
MTSPIDMKWMDRALDLAERGRYGVSPNPMVGAVVVRRGRVAGEGFHERAGAAHAEVRALDRAGKLARGSDLYVSLERAHTSGARRPAPGDPLTGIRRVVFAGRVEPARRGKESRRCAGGVEIVGSDRTRQASHQAERSSPLDAEGRRVVPRQ